MCPLSNICRRIYMSNNTMSKKVEVAIKHKSRYVDRLFTYLAPDEIKLGHRVEVPFGKGNKLHEALVINVIKEDEIMKNDEESKAIIYKAIANIKDETPIISDATMKIARWMKEQYMCSFFEALSLFLPKSENTAVKYKRMLVPLKNSAEIGEYKEKQRKNAKNKILLLEELIKGPVDIIEIQDLHKVIFSSAIKQLNEDGIAIVEKKVEYRIPKHEYDVKNKNIVLTQEQEDVYRGISRNLSNGKIKLLHGITGSGKTEVYIRLIEDAIESQKSAILLVPEISLTPQTIARFKNIFGDKIAVLHSHLSEGEKKDQWKIIESGYADIVIGARSAVFAPLKNLGIIIIDECHDDAYKSEQNPKYDTIDLSEKMMENYGLSVVIGTATPTIEQYYRAKKGEYDLFKLNERVNAKLPEIEIIDTIDELRQGNISLINNYIKSKIQKEIDAKRQVIIFLNKRGFANSLTCLDCGHTIKCKNCDITLNYHKNGDKLLCHYCGHTEKFERICKECGSQRLKEIGMGTQKIEEEIEASISGAEIIRLDRDTTIQKGNHEKLLNKFKEKQANILIGTQMISKGLDFEDVTLVVVLNADQGLRFPDYRSYEKTFSMVSQVAGRAGRGEQNGKVIVQTIEKENEVFGYIKGNDYEGLYENEIRLRRNFNYPPFGTIIRIVASSMSMDKAGNTSEKIRNAIDFYSKKRNAEFIALGPTPCIIQKIDKKYRWQLFYKLENQIEINLLKNIINFILSEKRSIIVDKDTTISVDINPRNMM